MKERDALIKASPPGAQILLLSSTNYAYLKGSPSLKKKFFVDVNEVRSDAPENE